MTNRKPLTVVDVTKLDWKELEALYAKGYDVGWEMASREARPWQTDPDCWWFRGAGREYAGTYRGFRVV